MISERSIVMNKKMITTLLASVCLLGPAGTIMQTMPQTVQAATKGRVQVKGKKKIRLYTAKGKKTKYYAYVGKKYAYSTKKRIKIGKKKYLAYKLSANSYWLLAKDAKLVKKTSTSSSTYAQANIKMPQGYTREALLEAYKGKPSANFIKACMEGMEINDFSRVISGETKADEKIINPDRLTASEQKELAEFSLRVINNAREQLGLRPWVYSTGTQRLTDDIAKEYQDNGRSIKDNGHYVAGIVRVCQKHGLNLDDNYVEDMAGFSINKKTMPMGEMKRDVYFGLKQMIFGFAGANETQRNNKSLYREWEHAGDLFNTQGSRHDGDYNYYGFSLSKTGNVYSMHYISVPSFVVESEEYNTGFRP